ncbi:MAG: ABC transporter permease [Solirubrobacterales bacterium]|nr:ABC transporter permease [Solirubrobacterales bacterium]
MTVLADLGFGPFDTAWLATALVLTTPILLAAVGELISERAGVLNVGLEGFMLAGAFFAYLATWGTGSLVVGVLAGIVGGMLLATVMALLCVEAKADQIVSGVGINLVAFGLTAYLFDEIFGDLAQTVVPTVGNVSIPLVSKIPEFGGVLFEQDPILYLSFLLVPAAWFLLYRTKWGLAIRAAGEMPAAADTAGISIRRIRWMAVLTAGGLAALGGAYLVIVEVAIFRQGMTAGRGFLALVAVIFGRWHPFGVLGAAFVLGATDALQLRLADDDQVPQAVWGVVAIIAAAFLVHQVLVRQRGEPRWTALALASLVAVSGIVLFATTPHVDLPSQVWRSLPYLLALVVLASAVAKARMPSKLTLPYIRGEG